MKTYKVYQMDCFSLNVADFKPVHARLDIEYVQITKENYNLVEKINKNPAIENQQLKRGDTGFFALYNGRVVGYGWYKDENSKFCDSFYRVKRKKGNLCYLCRFFVCEEMRGNNIYPAMITKLIEHREKKSPGGKYYISAYTDNLSSINGLLKVGFRFVGRYKFVRLLKTTINKKTLL